MNFFEKNQKLIFLILGAFVLRLVLSFFGTVQLDQGSFIAWGNMIAHNGFANFYNSWSDYLPGYLYFLWGLAKINVYGIIPETVLFKLPALFGDIITGVLIYKILAKSKGEKWGLFGAALYVFNPAVIANSALWGQVDSLTSLASILAIYLLPTSFIFSAIALAIGTLIKPQAAFVFPVVLFLFIKNKQKFSDVLIYCFTGLSVFVLAFYPFWNHGSLISFVIERLGVSLNQYPYTSVNAFNFWGFLGFWKPDSFYLQLPGYVLVLGTAVYLFVKAKKNNNIPYFFSAFIFAASFMFFTRIHERHLLPVFAPLAIAAIENPILLIPYIGFSVTYLANLYYGYVYIVDNFRSPFSDFVIKLFEISNLVFTGVIFYTLSTNIRIIGNKALLHMNQFMFSKKSKTESTEYKLPRINLSQNYTKTFLFLILLFAFITRIFNLGSPTTMYFDEVYHAFTAKVIMSSDVAKAWEWWNTPPEGFAYEWTHPPLAKLGMVLGMLVFGQNAFGWRIPGAILGVGSVYLVYVIAKKIFRDEGVGLLSAAVFSLDGLALGMSRIGMNDSYILFFMLLSLYMYLKEKNFLSALSFGLALSSKWSAIYAIPIFGVIFLSQKKKLNLSYLWFFTLPFIIYLLSYSDMFLTGHDLTTWWGMQKQMWWYHTGLRATHAYSSPWWSWPFLMRPIYLYTSDEIGGMVSRIYAFGNPFVFWFGLASVIVCLVTSCFEKNKKLGLVVFSYLIFFAPWALSPRIMFLYHYLPSVPFMAIAAGYVLRRYPKWIPYFFVPTLIIFIYFYPHWAGLQVPLWLDSSYYWIDSWR